MNILKIILGFPLIFSCPVYAQFGSSAQIDMAYIRSQGCDFGSTPPSDTQFDQARGLSRAEFLRWQGEFFNALTARSFDDYPYPETDPVPPPTKKRGRGPDAPDPMDPILATSLRAAFLEFRSEKIVDSGVTRMALVSRLIQTYNYMLGSAPMIAKDGFTLHFESLLASPKMLEGINWCNASGTQCLPGFCPKGAPVVWERFNHFEIHAQPNRPVVLPKKIPPPPPPKPCTYVYKDSLPTNTAFNSGSFDVSPQTRKSIQDAIHTYFESKTGTDKSIYQIQIVSSASKIPFVVNGKDQNQVLAENRAAAVLGTLGESAQGADPKINAQVAGPEWDAGDLKKLKKVPPTPQDYRASVCFQLAAGLISEPDCFGPAGTDPLDLATCQDSPSLKTSLPACEDKLAARAQAMQADPRYRDAFDVKYKSFQFTRLDIYVKETRACTEVEKARQSESLLNAKPPEATKDSLSPQKNPSSIIKK